MGQVSTSRRSYRHRNGRLKSKAFRPLLLLQQRWHYGKEANVNSDGNAAISPFMAKNSERVELNMKKTSSSIHSSFINVVDQSTAVHRFL